MAISSDSHAAPTPINQQIDTDVNQFRTLPAIDLEPDASHKEGMNVILAFANKVLYIASQYHATLLSIVNDANPCNRKDNLHDENDVQFGQHAAVAHAFCGSEQNPHAGYDGTFNDETHPHVGLLDDLAFATGTSFHMASQTLTPAPVELDKHAGPQHRSSRAQQGTLVLRGVAKCLSGIAFLPCLYLYMLGPKRILVLFLLGYTVSAMPTHEDWHREHNLPPDNTLAEGLSWFWHMIRPILPIPIVILSLAYSFIVLSSRINMQEPEAPLSGDQRSKRHILLGVGAFGSSAAMTIVYQTSTPDDQDIAVMCVVCVFFALPFATELGCLLEHGRAVYMCLIVTGVIAFLLVVPLLGGSIEDAKTRQLLKVIGPPLTIAWTWISYKAIKCTNNLEMRSPFRRRQSGRAHHVESGIQLPTRPPPTAELGVVRRGTDSTQSNTAAHAEINSEGQASGSPSASHHTAPSVGTARSKHKQPAIAQGHVQSLLGHNERTESGSDSTHAAQQRTSRSPPALANNEESSNQNATTGSTSGSTVCGDVSIDGHVSAMTVQRGKEAEQAYLTAQQLLAELDNTLAKEMLNTPKSQAISSIASMKSHPIEAAA